MIKLRTHRKLAERSLPQRHEQVNNTPHRIKIYPLSIKHSGFDSRAILADALISSWEMFRWSKNFIDYSERLIRRYIFGFFVVSLSVFQIIPTTESGAITNDIKIEKPAEISISDSVKAVSAPLFQRPLNGYLSQQFWYVHPAIDIPNPYGASIKPVASGKVVFAGWDGGYGYTIVIKHKAGFSSRYAHLAQINVGVGQKIDKKTTVGTVGATGYATGSHLHLELYNEGKLVNPEIYLP